MFETSEEKCSKTLQVQKEISEYFEALEESPLIPTQIFEIFYSKKSLRLHHLAFKILKESKTFLEIQIDTESFKSKDLIKISQLNNDLFYIDLKKTKIYTMDKEFHRWCGITGRTIDSIRLA